MCVCLCMQFKQSPWYAGILTEDDFGIVNPHRASFLRQLRELSSRKQRILRDRSVREDQKNIQLGQLLLPSIHDSGSSTRLEELRYIISVSVYHTIVFTLPG